MFTNWFSSRREFKIQDRVRPQWPVVRTVLLERDLVRLALVGKNDSSKGGSTAKPISPPTLFSSIPFDFSVSLSLRDPSHPPRLHPSLYYVRKFRPLSCHFGDSHRAPRLASLTRLFHEKHSLGHRLHFLSPLDLEFLSRCEKSTPQLLGSLVFTTLSLIKDNGAHLQTLEFLLKDHVFENVQS